MGRAGDGEGDGEGGFKMTVQNKPSPEEIFEAGYREGWEDAKRRSEEAIWMWVDEDEREDHLGNKKQLLAKLLGEAK